MKVKLIVATDLSNGIGKNNDLLWHLPNDMRFFRETTQNSIVVMGRKNWESIPEKFRPLKNRKNVVITRDPNYQAEGAFDIGNWDQFLTVLADIKEDNVDVFIIGGAEIYNLALQSNIVDEMYITKVNANLEADTFFKYDEEKWYKSEKMYNQPIDENHSYSFEIYHYTKYATINNGRKVGIGDKVLCYTEEGSFSWNNGFKIIQSFKDGMISAYDFGSEAKGLTYYGTGLLY